MSYPSNPTDPFAPPGPQAQPHLQNPQAWAPVQQPGYAAPAPSGAPHQPFAPAPRGGYGLAITAIVLSGPAPAGRACDGSVLFGGAASSWGSLGPDR